MFLASPAVRQPSFFFAGSPTGQDSSADPAQRAVVAIDRFASSSPEPLEPPPRTFGRSGGRRPSMLESSGMSGTELASHSDFSDCDIQRHHGASFESLTFQSPPMISSPANNNATATPGGAPNANANASQVSGINNLEQDPDRVIWQGWMWFLRSKGGVRQWKKSWAVLRPRNFKLHKDETESSVLFIAYLSSIVNVVDIDPMSRTKKHCLQIITDEKSYKFCAQGEEELVQCLGAFKSLLAKRRELEAKAATVATAPPTATTTTAASAA